MRKLTPKQEKYVQGLVSGLSQRKAYIQAGYSVKRKTESSIDRDASMLLKNPKVFQRYQELLEEGKTSAVVSLKEKREQLAKIIRQEIFSIIETVNDGPAGPSSSKRIERKIENLIKAIELDNKMDPDYYELGKSEKTTDDPLSAYFAETDAECDKDE